MSIFDLNFPQEDGAARHCQDLLGSQSGLHGRARLRCAAQRRNNGEWHNVMSVVQVFPRGKEPAAEKSWGYAEFRLFELWLGTHEAVDLLRLPGEHERALDSHKVKLHCGFHNLTLHSGENEYSMLPGYLYQGSRFAGVGVSSEPLVAFDQPFFSGGLGALRQWFGFDVQQSDSRFGSMVVFVPECRARLAAVSAKAGKVVIKPEITMGKPEDYCVKGAWTFAGKSSPYERAIGPEIVLDVPLGAEALQVYLIGRDNNLYDFHDESRFWHGQRKRVLTELKSVDEGDTVQKALRSGESDTVEFKPFIEEGHPKKNELVESVIAFSNTQGGVIILGVNKNCIPDGIDTEEAYKKAYQKAGSREKLLENYKGWIRRLVSDNLTKTVELDIREAALDSHLLLVISVPEGDHKPYANAFTKEIKIRRGANNVIPDPDTELPKLFQRDDGGPLGRILGGRF